MKLAKEDVATEARQRLVEIGGLTSQDLGLGRIVGQMLVYLYLRDGACSMDELELELGLSKASVSVASRQLESLGLIRRVWRKGDRRNYYRTADDIGSALRQGLLGVMHRKVEAVGAELDQVADLLREQKVSGKGNEDIAFLISRVTRASELQSRATKLLGSPLLKLIEKIV